MIVLLLGFSVMPVCYADINVKAIAWMCGNCHGAVEAANTLPSLTGLSGQDIQEKLLAFKYDKRLASIMPRIAKGYTDAELQAVAQYLGKK